ncbi:MAG: NAD(P)/FAD-dependent oxidoreductase [Candidatus Bathyarchaeota archaeon]|nr:NAD(P)/FAD-dependent oxidoreductase [Candidatus Bathyarchaeota archaeon]
MKKFDVIVVGAGTAGSMTAKTAAEAGLEVGLIDRKPKEKIGEKVCGDAIGKHHFDTLGLKHPSGNELQSEIAGVKIYSPDMETVFQIESEMLYGFIVNRHLFGQRLLKLAVNAGATLLDSTQVIEPILKDNAVIGVSARDIKTETKIPLQSKVVIDASGFLAVLRKKLPPEIGMDIEVSNEDVEVCYREIRQLSGHVASPDFCEIYLDQNTAPGGYYWIFPEGETKTNVGVGVRMTRDFPKPKNQLYNEVLSKPLFKDSTPVTGGAWYVPTRRPLDCIVGNGIVVVGDSACQVNPIHGGGMGPSMRGGMFAGETIVEALEKGDVTREGLWQYNVRYMQSYGVKQAGLDIFRLFLLQGVSDEEINYGMKYQLITEEDILKTSMGENVRLNITEVARRALKGLGKLSMLRRLRNAARLMRETKLLYRNYPTSPKGFEEWKKKTHELITTANRLLSRKQ